VVDAAAGDAGAERIEAVENRPAEATEPGTAPRRRRARRRRKRPPRPDPHVTAIEPRRWLPAYVALGSNLDDPACRSSGR